MGERVGLVVGDVEGSSVCFDGDSHGDYSCIRHVQVGVVRCGAFLLWRLPDAPDCYSGIVGYWGYCQYRSC